MHMSVGKPLPLGAHASRCDELLPALLDEATRTSPSKGFHLVRSSLAYTILRGCMTQTRPCISRDGQ